MPRRHFEPKKSLGPKLSSYIAKGTTDSKCLVLRHKVPTFSTTTNYKQANPQNVAKQFQSVAIAFLNTNFNISNNVNNF